MRSLRVQALVRACILALAIPGSVMLGAGVGTVVVGLPQTEGAVVALLCLSTGAGLLVAGVDWLADVVSARLVAARLRALRARQELAWAERVRADARDEEQRRLDDMRPVPVTHPLDQRFRARA